MKHILDDHEFKQYMRLLSEHRAKKHVSHVLGEMTRVLKLWTEKAKNNAKCREEAEGIRADGEDAAELMKRHYENMAEFMEHATNALEKIWGAYIANDGKENE